MNYQQIRIERVSWVRSSFFKCQAVYSLILEAHNTLTATSVLRFNICAVHFPIESIIGVLKVKLIKVYRLTDYTICIVSFYRRLYI